MESNTTQFAIIERTALATVIDALKKLDVRGFESADRWVGSIIMLERAYSNPISMPKDNKVDSSPTKKEG